MSTLHRVVRAAALFIAVGLISAGAFATSGTSARAAGTTYTPISGTGSTWSQNALDQWRKNVATNYGMTVNYSGTGSSAGRRDFQQGIVDFAVSEIPFQAHPEDGSPPEVPTTSYAYMPIVAGGTAFMYNLNIGGKRVTNLRLSGGTITGIFTGSITNWNDPLIKADNPGLTMPNKPIVPVVRSDGSGSTAQFTLWMSKQYPTQWNAFCKLVNRPVPCGLTSQYPTYGNEKAQSGSLGVAGYVSQSYGDGAITYVEYSYALKSGFPVAKVLNASGYYVEPKAPAVAVALLKAQINTDKTSKDYLTEILDGVYNNTDKRTYPLSSYSYMIVPTQVAGVFTKDKGRTLGVFANYMLCEGQQQAAALGYSPLPMNLVLAGYAQIANIPGAAAPPVDLSAITATCHNPTFKPGDSPSNNQLAVTAPQPPACDQKGPIQCATGTGGAQQATPVSGGSNNAGSTTGGTGATGATSPGGSGDGTGDGTSSGGQINFDSASAVSKPLVLASSTFGVPQMIMIAAGLLLLVAIVLPPLLSARLKKADVQPPR